MTMVREFEKFVVGQKGILIRDGKCLVMKISLTKKRSLDQGKWDLPGGRIDKDEDYNKNFEREIEEETGIKDFKVLGVVDICLYKVSIWPFCGIMFLIENEKDEIVMSDEHMEMKWIKEDEIDDYEYCWPKMGEMIKKGFTFYRKLSK